MNLTVKVLHNVSPDTFTRYRPDTSRLYHAHDFEVVADNVQLAASVVWHLANVDSAEDLVGTVYEAYGDQVTAYRKRMNRSLSVSDVLIFHEGDRLAGVLVVESVGFEGLEFLPEYAEGRNETSTSRSYYEHRLAWR